MQRDAGILAPDALATLAVHDTQLDEALAGVVVIVVACTVRARRDGDRLRAAVATYAVLRIVVDLFRGDLAHAWLAIAVLGVLARAT